MNRIYLTEYRDNDSTFASHLWARSTDEAARLCVERGIGESLSDAMPLDPLQESSDYRPASWHVMNSEQETALHALAWLGHLALSSLAVPVRDVLGDYGFLHEAIHLVGGVESCSGYEDWMVVADAASEIEMKVPGYPP